ncbi:motility protein A [Mariniblastus fucicola]|uniref:Chemotaxis protein PomA n=1 Tax=Mariniblastus fucicola TaxID=980251 RepID=A0A5B9PFG6_9BACT|nr:MotA/TolQ/ExbB proton channel family protein [Mariniblastus fucicola]QEG23376.1 Chemotaxis protein PomA [Mariniblastus fucicola]
MDIATIIGLILGFGLIFASIAMGGGGLSPFIDAPSMMIVFGGSISAALINFPLKNVLGSFSVVLNCFFQKIPEPKALIGEFKELAQLARKDGLLALEQKSDSIEDDFMKRGIESLIGGTPADELRETMETELGCIDERHSMGKKFVDAMGAAAPAFGMIGTLIGLVQMLQSLDDPSKIGGGMAVALLTTLYGAVVANVVCIPLAGKLEARAKEETVVREMIIAGVAAIGGGATPRAVEEQLATFMAPKSRADVGAEAA